MAAISAIKAHHAAIDSLRQQTPKLNHPKISSMMKHLLLPLVLLLAISLPLIAATGVANATQLVYDTDGHEMNSYSSYYILPAEKGTAAAAAGGGLKLNSLTALASFVIQAPSEADHGYPVKFSPLNASSDGMTRLSTDTKIIFAIITTRVESLYWYVSSSSSSGPRQRVAIPEYLKKPPGGFVFRVERHVAAAAGGAATKGYKLVWCDDGKMKPCRDLGLYESEGKTWLATGSDSPFVVVFKKRELGV